MVSTQLAGGLYKNPHHQEARCPLVYNFRWLKGISSGSQSQKLKILFARSVTFSEMTYHLLGQLVTKKLVLLLSAQWDQRNI